jgi:hypothetical protein
MRSLYLMELTFGENDVERPEATDCIAEICCVTFKGDQRGEVEVGPRDYTKLVQCEWQRSLL